MRRSRFAFFLLVTLTLPACDSTGAPGEPEEAWVLEEWTLSEDLRIGGPDGPGPALSRIGGVLALPDGGVWILQPSSQDVRVHAADGSLLRRVGRSGQRPGEFMLPNRMGWWGASGDTVWVSDLGLRRLSLFTVDGAFARSLDMPFVEHQGRFTVTQPTSVLPDGSALALASYSPRETEWADFPIVRYDLSGGWVQRELARVDRTNQVSIRWQGEGVSTAIHPVSDAPLVAFGPYGERVLILDRTVDGPEPGRVRLSALGPEGDTLWSRSYAYDPLPLPGAEADSLFARPIASLQQLTRLQGTLSDEQAEQAYREAVTVPGHRPAVDAVRVGLDGRIWISWASAPGQPGTWWVLEGDGTPVAALTAERDLDVRAADEGYLWTVDAADPAVPYVVRYRLTDGTG